MKSNLGKTTEICVYILHKDSYRKCVVISTFFTKLNHIPSVGESFSLSRESMVDEKVKFVDYRWVQQSFLVDDIVYNLPENCVDVFSKPNFDINDF